MYGPNTSSNDFSSGNDSYNGYDTSSGQPWIQQPGYSDPIPWYNNDSSDVNGQNQPGGPSRSSAGGQYPNRPNQQPSAPSHPPPANGNSAHSGTSNPSGSQMRNVSESIGNHSSPEVADGAKSSKTSLKKKKRKTGGSEADAADAEADKEKRTKTGRACDACRTKKIRCDILPSEASNGGREPRPICAHCKQYDLECTFFLPITETRFKKRKATEDQVEPTVSFKHSTTSSPRDLAPREVPTRTEGPTSLSFLLHTSLPASASEAYDLREHNRWEVSEGGDGLIRVSAPPHGNSGDDAEDPARAYDRLVKPSLNAATISSLVNAYFDHIAPLFPVILRSDFTAKSNPFPLLLYAICGLGATRRHFPREIFAGVRGMINGLLKSNDILSDARFEHVQALLLIAQVGDLHAQPTAATASASLIRLASAIRMAQDLGLHRESSLRAQSAQDLAFVELRRRVWAACVILDRWYAAALGIPLLVDLLDCDVLLPAPYEIVPDAEASSWRVEPSYMYIAEHLKLAILIGRVLKTIYSPTGLKHTTDDQLGSILTDMTAWKDNLPAQLKYQGPSSSSAAGLLHMSFAALQFLFWRVFMRITYVVPTHLNFRLRPSHWTRMVNDSTDSIQWLSANDTVLDTVFVFAYTATSCALIQYHTWARRKDMNALEMLRLVKETATRWEAAVQPDQMSIRRKTCETMTLLHEAALKTNPDSEDFRDRPAAINPTPGVLPRENVGRIAWVKGESYAEGGFWVAKTDQDRMAGGVAPHHVVVLHELDPSSEQAMRARTALGAANQHPAMSQGQNILDGRHSNGNPSTTADVSTNPLGGTSDMSGHFGGIAHGFLPVELQTAHNVANLNPQINVEQGIHGMATDPVLGLMSASAPPPHTDNPLDLGSLDTLPMSSFDFPSWEQYFSAINSVVSNDVSPENDVFFRKQL